MIDFDNNATTEPSGATRRAMMAALSGEAGNPSSLHRRGRIARGMIEGARAEVAALAGTRAEAVCFTSGATEGNAAVLSMAERKGATLVTTTAEHAAVTAHYDHHAPARILRLPVDADGTLDPARLDVALAGTDGRALFAFQWANGETGVLQPAATLTAIARRHGATVLLDAAQAFGRVETTLAGTGADFATLSAHKLHGPAGVGALVVLSGAAAPAFNPGGGQEGGRRGGTENLAGIAGFGAACSERMANLDGAIHRLAILRDRFETRLRATLPDIRINARTASRVPNTSSVTFFNIDGMALVARLEEAGLLCSQVSACSAARPEASRTLLAMGVSEDEAFSSLRFALSVVSTAREVDHAVAILASVSGDLRGRMRAFA